MQNNSKLLTLDFGDFLGSIEFYVNFEMHRRDEITDISIPQYFIDLILIFFLK
ncbi:hypothetical protein ACFL6D_01470 [Spirochaetota bacterium]